VLSAIQERSRGTDGAPRIHAELAAEGIRVGRQRVARLMRSAGLAVVIDAFSRRLAGWTIATHLRTERVLKALHRALEQHRPEDVIHHADQGAPYFNVVKH
jgi:transposase InsO family protein